jgi:hypothetical protein
LTTPNGASSRRHANPGALDHLDDAFDLRVNERRLLGKAAAGVP